MATPGVRTTPTHAPAGPDAGERPGSGGDLLRFPDPAATARAGAARARRTGLEDRASERDDRRTAAGRRSGTIAAPRAALADAEARHAAELAAERERHAAALIELHVRYGAALAEARAGRLRRLFRLGRGRAGEAPFFAT